LRTLRCSNWRWRRHRQPPPRNIKRIGLLRASCAHGGNTTYELSCISSKQLAVVLQRLKPTLSIDGM